MAGQSFDLLLFGRRKLANAAGSTPSQSQLTKLRLRIVQQVFNSRRVVYRNRVETNRRNLVLSTIENEHQREQATQRLQKTHILSDLKHKNAVVDSSIAFTEFYEPIDITEPKTFYRFGVRIQSAAPHTRSRAPATRSNRDNPQSRAKSASTTTRPFTAPLQTFYQEDTESDDETIPYAASRLTSAKTSNNYLTPATASSIFSSNSLELNLNKSDNVKSNVRSSSSHRITWPVSLKVFAIQDEDESRQKFLAWRAEQRKTKPRRQSKQFLDVELERKYQESVRKRKQIESFVTPDLVAEHNMNDPVFAKRYRQLKLAIRAGKIPIYDPADREINLALNKTKIERARTALITAKQSKMKSIYQDQQRINDAILSKRIETFLKSLEKFKEEEQEQI